ncbi:Calx-beta domain-containing protein [Amaricoccus macauensis]|uniref:Calx-beta domain-containing protein n=1 Tax=Amaricoccus macauensis TaxID=57001 RepID=UPI003C7B4AF7
MATIDLEGGVAPEGTSSSSNYLVWTFDVSGAQTSDVRIYYRFLTDTAYVGTDTSAAYDSYVTIDTDETSESVRLRVTADALAEHDEAVVLEAYSVSAGNNFIYSGPVMRSVGWILDDDGVNEKRALHVSRPIVAEGDNGRTDAVFELSLSRPADGNITVDYETVDGSAIAGEDYIAKSGSVTFLDGEDTATVTVRIKGDTDIEPVEGFTLAVDAPEDIVDVSIGEAEILDDDAAADAGMPSVHVSGSARPEGTGSSANYANWAITLSEAATGTVRVYYRTFSDTALDGYYYAGADVQHVDSYVTFDPGETSQTVRARINADALTETDEAVTLEVYNVSGGPKLANDVPYLSATSWILDDDGITDKLAMVVRSPTVNEGHKGERNAEFEFELSRPATETMTVDYKTVDGSAKAGVDYEKTKGSVTFVEGQTKASVAVKILGDKDFEASEHFSLSIDAPSEIASISNHIATILDDDAAADDGMPTVSVDGSHSPEGTSSQYLYWTISLSEPPTGPVDVEYRFLSREGIIGSDTYTSSYSGTARFQAGETSKIVSLRLIDDTVSETDETITLEAFNVTGGAKLENGAPVLRADSWIMDDDGTTNKLALAVSEPTVTETGLDDRHISVNVSLSRAATSTFSVDYRTVDGTAKSGKDYVKKKGTLTFEEGQREASFSLKVLGDAKLETPETFRIAIDAPGAVADVQSGTVTIHDGSITGSTEDDSLSGTKGSDAIFGDDGNDRITGLAGDDALAGGNGKDEILGGDGNDEILGDKGKDTLKGNNGNDKIFGGKSNDKISGGKGKDTIKGGAGDDKIEGGQGRDKLQGDDGSDIFIFKSAEEAGNKDNRDLITDFKRGKDIVDLSKIDANERKSGDQKFDFIGKDSFSGDKGELRMKNGVLSGDIDGDKTADFQIELDGILNLSKDDLIL